MSSWACKCVYYWPEHNAKGEPNGTAFQRSWNAETKDTKKKKKNGDNDLVIMFSNIMLMAAQN